jgi:hypothetical protein
MAAMWCALLLPTHHSTCFAALAHRLGIGTVISSANDVGFLHPAFSWPGRLCVDV